jgi:hypothetical protein
VSKKVIDFKAACAAYEEVVSRFKMDPEALTQLVYSECQIAISRGKPTADICVEDLVNWERGEMREPLMKVSIQAADLLRAKGFTADAYASDGGVMIQVGGWLNGSL